MALTINETAHTLSLSRATVYRRIDDGTLEGIKIGGRRLVTMKSIQALLEPDPLSAPVSPAEVSPAYDIRTALSRDSE